MTNNSIHKLHITVDREIFAGINFKIFLMFTSFNFRCLALPMKIKPRRKCNALLYHFGSRAFENSALRELKRAHRAMTVIIYLQKCQLFDALIM